MKKQSILKQIEDNMEHAFATIADNSENIPKKYQKYLAFSTGVFVAITKIRLIDRDTSIKMINLLINVFKDEELAKEVKRHVHDFVNNDKFLSSLKDATKRQYLTVFSLCKFISEIAVTKKVISEQEFRKIKDGISVIINETIR
jgi:hypothetical protein